MLFTLLILTSGKQDKKALGGCKHMHIHVADLLVGSCTHNETRFTRNPLWIPLWSFSFDCFQFDLSFNVRTYRCWNVCGVIAVVRGAFPFLWVGTDKQTQTTWAPMICCDSWNDTLMHKGYVEQSKLINNININSQNVGRFQLMKRGHIYQEGRVLGNNSPLPIAWHRTTVSKVTKGGQNLWVPLPVLKKRYLYTFT